MAGSVKSYLTDYSIPSVLFQGCYADESRFFPTSGRDYRQYSFRLPRTMARLSWPEWLIKYQDGANVIRSRERSPIPVVTDLK